MLIHSNWAHSTTLKYTFAVQALLVCVRLLSFQNVPALEDWPSQCRHAHHHPPITAGTLTTIHQSQQARSPPFTYHSRHAHHHPPITAIASPPPRMIAPQGVGRSELLPDRYQLQHLGARPPRMANHEGGGVEGRFCSFDLDAHVHCRTSTRGGGRCG